MPGLLDAHDASPGEQRWQPAHQGRVLAVLTGCAATPASAPAATACSSTRQSTCTAWPRCGARWRRPTQVRRPGVCGSNGPGRPLALPTHLQACLQGHSLHPVHASLASPSPSLNKQVCWPCRSWRGSRLTGASRPQVWCCSWTPRCASSRSSSWSARPSRWVGWEGWPKRRVFQLLMQAAGVDGCGLASSH